MFKIGDRVRRISGEYLGMTPGDVGTVVGINSLGVELAEFSEDGTRGSHDVRKLVLIEDSPRAAQASPTDTADLSAIPAGRKDDGGKLDMNLLDDMPRALKAVVEVMQWAIVDKKPVPYVRGSWLGVEPDRYRAAVKRHERSAAEQATLDTPARLQRDEETNLLHLAHTACSAMMALENTLRELEKS